MAIQLKSVASNIAAWVRALGSTTAPTGGEGVLDAHLTDLNGLPLAKLHGASANVAQFGMPASGMNDSSIVVFRADRLGNQASALHTPLLHDSFEGTTVNPVRWTITATTMTGTQTTVGGLQFNGSAITTTGTGYMIKSRPLIKMQRAPLQAKFRAQFDCVNNSVMEAGFINATTAIVANTTGAYWQAASNGVIQPVLTFNGSDITGTNIRSQIDTTKFYTFDVIVDDDEVIFMVQNSETQEIISRQSIKLPLGAARLLSAASIAFGARVYNTGVAPASAPIMRLTDVYCLSLDQVQTKPWPHVLATLERGLNWHPLTGASFVNWTNSNEPANAAPTNTTAIYSNVFQGKFNFNALVGATTDLLVFALPMPANAVITGVDVDMWNTGAAGSATVPSMFEWFIGVNSTAQSLATAGIGRFPVGAMSFPINAAIGAMASPSIKKTFSSPLHCQSGRWLQVAFRQPVGAATASQIHAGHVAIEGYFE